MQGFQGGEQVFRPGLPVEGLPGIVAGQDGPIVMNSEVFRIRKGIMHVQCIGLHFLREQFPCDVGEQFFVPAVGKEENDHS